MKEQTDYKKLNKKAWNIKTDIHFISDFYDNESFIKGRNSLNSIEIDLLGDIKGKTILHLQCHFGQDTISLNRMGAKSIGVDISDKAVERAKELAAATKSDADFICCDIYDLPEHLDKKFDIVFTSYGTIGWLPDLNKWANIISGFLKPGGKLVFAEFHPVVWMFDDDFKFIQYRYFNSGPIIESVEGTYADKKSKIVQKYVCWNHGISEVIGSLLNNNFIITSFNEFDYSPYDCFNNTIEIEPGKFRIKHLGDKIPMVYSVTAIRK